MKHFYAIVFYFTIVFLSGCRTAKQNNYSSELFEGTIKFENSITSENLSDSDQNYYNLFGNIEIMTFARGNILNEFPNGKEYVKTLYNNNSNNYYLFYRSGEIKYFNCSNESDEIVEISKSNEIVKICGYQCKSIKLDFGRFTMTYYYAEILKVNPILFENHKYRHFNTLYKQSNSIILKSIMESKNMKFISTAIEVKKLNISSRNFEEPTGAKKF